MTHFANLDDARDSFPRDRFATVVVVDVADDSGRDVAQFAGLGFKVDLPRP